MHAVRVQSCCCSVKLNVECVLSSGEMMQSALERALTPNCTGMCLSPNPNMLWDCSPLEKGRDSKPLQVFANVMIDMPFLERLLDLHAAILQYEGSIESLFNSLKFLISLFPVFVLGFFNHVCVCARVVGKG